MHSVFSLDSTKLGRFKQTKPIPISYQPRSFKKFSVNPSKQIIKKLKPKTSEQVKKEAERSLKNNETKKPNPLLKAGKKLPRIYKTKFPSKLIGVPLEDIDEFYLKNENVKRNNFKILLIFKN